jgi:hypothetical protein
MDDRRLSEALNRPPRAAGSQPRGVLMSVPELFAERAGTTLYYPFYTYAVDAWKGFN